jgi:excisionase family DNA binding protein
MSETNGDVQRDILNIDEAAELLGVSVKTFNKVLHSEDMPARKIGREWKFSRQALIAWVGNGRSREFYREGSAADSERDDEITPARAPDRPAAPDRASPDRTRSRRTAGWAIELD